MITNEKQFELGYAGLALLRNRLIGNIDTTEHIAKELIKIVNEMSGEIYAKTNPIKKYNVKDGYRDWSDTYDTMPNLLLKVEEPVIRNMLKKIKPGIAVDAACGTGRISRILTDMGHNVTGFDNSSEMLNQAIKRVENAKFFKGNLDNLPFSDEGADLAVCALALTHLPEPYGAIGELNRIVRKGGHIILSDIHPWFVIIGGQAEFQNKHGEKGFVYNNVHLHSKYLHIFNQLGLKVVQCVEPLLSSKDLDPAMLGLNISSKLFDTALENLPLVLIWHLEKTI